MPKTILSVLLLALASIYTDAQTVAGLPENPSPAGYDPQALFAPGFYNDLHLATRQPNGAPSATYWQNRADYTLAVRLDTLNNQLEGSAQLRYTNNSPDTLHSVWLYLDQQTYRKDARSNYYTDYAAGGHTDGYRAAVGKTRTGRYHRRRGLRRHRHPHAGPAEKTAEPQRR
ncbi:hypothetical protein ACQ86N_22440 [Puia sp. P3]|uniref:hypothetical protein n=1 Tax=Puia sp. P3 TaxID=3423952 RepID=UPI003D67B3F8